ncbi:MAG: hypothetical protein HeimC2_13390 [Candidatus Heimdallarchaeota archaeon LC_2]|nr:MAG: hypothetical protein HeimC2_13390 [Candidatus Heimdallarchaeota archaeon LC_2]
MTIKRSLPAPLILTNNKSDYRYRHRDVKDQLYQDFLGKCYLCEQNISSAFDVDHREQKSLNQTNDHRKFDWTNLYPACSKCNQRRPKFQIGDLLFPADGDDVESLITQRPSIDKSEIYVKIFPLSSDHKAKNTAKELNHIVNHRTDSSALRIRTNISMLIIKIQNCIYLFDHPASEAVKLEMKDSLERYFNKSYAFSTMLRQYFSALDQNLTQFFMD